MLRSRLMLGGSEPPVLLLSSNPSNWGSIGQHYSQSNAGYNGFSGTFATLTGYGGFSGRTSAIYAACSYGSGQTTLTPNSTVLCPSFAEGGGVDVYLDHFVTGSNSVSGTAPIVYFGSSSYVQHAYNGLLYGNAGNSQSVTLSAPAGSARSVRVQMTTTAIRLKQWLAGSVEPDAWGTTLNLSTQPLGAGSPITFSLNSAANNGGSGYGYVGGWAVWKIAGPHDALLPWPLADDFGT